MSVTTFYTQATIDGLTNISADSIDTSALTADSLDLSGNLSCYNINANNIIGNDLHLNGTLDIDENIILNTAGSYIEFGDGSIQTTAAIGQGVGVVRRYINAYSNQDQLNLSTSAYNIMSFNVTDSHNGITIVNDASGNPTKITFEKTGAYLMIISVQVKKDDAGDDDVYFWVAKNGIDIADSNTLSTLSKNGDVDLVTVNFGLNVNAGDYLQWRWFSQDTNLYLHYDASQTINSVALPATPSVILSIEETNSTYNSLQDVDISGNLFVSGNTDISGNLNVVGNITGNWNINDLHLTGNLTVDGSANFTDLDVTGTSNLNILDVNQINYNGNINIQEATITNLTVDGSANITNLIATDATITNITSTNINTGQIQATSGTINNLTSTTATIDTLNGRIGSFINNTNMVPVETQLSYPGGVLYHDYNPMTLTATSGWTYIIYNYAGAINKNIIYNGIDSFNVYYAMVGPGGGGGGGSVRGSSTPTISNTQGGGGGGGSSGLLVKNTTALTMSTSKYFRIDTIGIGGLGGAGGRTSGSIAVNGNAGSTGGTSQFYTDITSTTYTASSGLGGAAPTASGSYQYILGGMGAENFTQVVGGATQYFGYGGGRIAGSTDWSLGQLNTTSNRSGGNGGWYYYDPTGSNGFINATGTNYSFADGSIFVQEGGCNAIGNVTSFKPTYYGRGGGGGSGTTTKYPDGTYRAYTGGIGANGCFMIYFQTSQMTQVPTYSLSTKGFYNTSYTIPNYDSGWFAVVNNTNYSKTHNLNLTITAPPIIWFFFTATVTPAAPIYVMYPNGLINNNTTNYNSGIMKIDPFTTPNVLTFSTEANAVYYATGGTNIRYDSGYVRVIIRY